MTPPETVLEELRNAQMLVISARTASEGRAVVDMLAGAEHRIAAAIEQLSAPPRSSRRLSKRQIAALAALQVASSEHASAAELREAIGPYATNVIKSLVDRGLIERAAGGFYRITPAGFDARRSA